MACVKVYLCSNPEDSVVERKFLRVNVFPKLRDHCRRTHGVDFKVIDPYEGMDSGSWPTQKVRLQLIEECRLNSLGPFFVGLVGEEYGAACLPEQVELSEFLMLLQVCQQMGFSCDILEKCYRRDENTVPPSFCLLSQPARSVEDGDWHDVLVKGRKIIRDVVTQCVLEGDIHPEKAQKYFRSSLENDLRFTLEGRSPADIKRCLCYVNKTAKEADQKNKGNEPHSGFQAPSVRPSDLHFALEGRSPADIKGCLCYVNKTAKEADQKNKGNEPHAGFQAPSVRPSDLHFALEGRSPADIKGCLCYVNRTATEADQKNKGNEPHTGFQAPSVRLRQLLDDFLPNMVRTQRALVYTTTTEYDGQQSYAEDLGHQLYSDLQKLIDRSVVREKDQTHDVLSQQRDLCHTFSCLYKIEREEVTHVRAYLEQDTKHPFILTGGPCTGKSVFLAHCANQIKTWMKDQDPVVIVQFSDLNSSLKQSLSSICHQLALSYNQPYNICPKDIFELKETFNNLLTTSSLSSNHLILIIDGLDQVPNTNVPLDLTWLPKTLPSNVKLFISSTPTKSGLLSALKGCYPESSFFFELEPLDSKSCNRMLKTLLLSANRKITSGQQMYVNQVFKKCSLPLYMELLHRQVCCWGSELEITSETLVPGVHTNIGRFLDHLEEKHGKVLVSRAVQCLTLSRHGLTEAELTDILSCDDEVLSTFIPVDYAVPYKLRVPEVVVERLLLDLKGFLMVRRTSGTKTLFWVSRHFNLVICKRYLSSDEQKKMHTLLANYFSGRWSCGTAKPLIIIGRSSMKMLNPNKDLKIYMDRQVPGQPWMFQPLTSILPACDSSENAHPNLRKLQELPFHLMQSGSIEELGHIMLSQEFLHAMFQAMLAEELIFWLEKTSQKVFPRELRLLATILKTSTCWPKNSFEDLALIMQTKLFPFINVFPELEKFVHQARHDGSMKSTGVNTILFPTSSVPATHWVPPEADVSPIIKAAVSQFGSAVVIRDNGSAWVWNGSDSEGFRLSQSSEFQFADVRCSANVFVLSTQSGKFLLWDTNAPSHLQEVQTECTEQGQNTIEGILVCNGKIFAFSHGRRFIRVFAEGIEVTPLQCSSEVTCMSCSEDGHLIFCGQNEGTVSIFDSQTGQPLASFMCSTGMSLFDLIFLENGETITCVDSTGSVFVWDLEMITNPVLIKESLSCTKEEVLSTDHSENNLLLICKRHQIQIIAGYVLDVVDKFNALNGKTFVQAILDPDAHFIFALMNDCPFLLVWNRVSGQCMLSLDTRSTQAFKLTKLRDFPYLTAVTSRGIVSWDMDLISVAASTPKSDAKVVKVVVEPLGEHFYTADGSKLVWRWTVSDGKLESHLLHHGPVEAMVLSVDGAHLVTIASGDIYVWNTCTKENVHRICFSQASQILLTPKGNFAVSLSETGISRVWKLCSGHVICSIHHHLRDAVISPESTFLLGINGGDLLAVSLWSGYISKQFSSCEWSEVVAFLPLSDHPDYVIVMTSSGALYSWKLTEETVCHQFQFPESFKYPRQFLKLSSDGSYGIVSVAESKINILDVYHGKLCSLNAEGQVCQSFVDISRKYAVYVCNPSVRCQNYSCDFHNKEVLVAIRVTDGKRVSKFYLCKTPSVVVLSEELHVYVGFEDGSVGVYAINDPDGDTISRPKCESLGLVCPFDEPEIWPSLANPDFTWVEVASERM
ncbi:NACHT and WD repeat domain-containing protein 2 [Colossoma macropomum]|uniref:NACHT and WD repeat domain-containing protein 2 n=1 Tax=Colossoma macropomum TaxID=42526 RepID=UPI001863A9B7|nr:NACHT and WD repeat domain-containing protein 2 [Colossoma macropomum]